MMDSYDTYREAVLVNGSTKGVVTTCEYWTGSPWFEGKFTFKTKHERPDVGEGKWVRCNPADYLDTLESFLASGKRLIEGDSYIERRGNVVSVVSDDADSIYYGGDTPQSTANSPMKHDDKRFILQAAADQVETPCSELRGVSPMECFNAISQQVNSLTEFLKTGWKHGDNCTWNGKEVVFVAPLPSKPSLCVIEPQAPSERMTDIVRVSELSKPETPAEREERERWEAAYKLYCTLSNAIGRPTMTFEEFTAVKQPEGWLAVVDETGYRKQ